MSPNKTNSRWPGRDVTVEVDINPLADVIALQIPPQFQSNARDIYELKIDDVIQGKTSVRGT